MYPLTGAIRTKRQERMQRVNSYHALTHALPQALPYIFSQFSMAWGLFAMDYHALLSIFFKKY